MRRGSLLSISIWRAWRAWLAQCLASQSIAVVFFSSTLPSPTSPSTNSAMRSLFQPLYSHSTDRLRGEPKYKREPTPIREELATNQERSAGHLQGCDQRQFTKRPVFSSDIPTRPCTAKSGHIREHWPTYHYQSKERDNS